MQFRSKALYHLLRSYWLLDPSLKVEMWQVEDYRSLSEDEIWKRLEEIGILLDRTAFELYASNVENPEELLSRLCVDFEEDAEYDQAYLLLFELWRRLLPEKKSLSLFCDELDHRITFYENEEEGSEELIADALFMLEGILDQNSEGAEPQQVFAVLIEHCAHDLESFLYSFISQQIIAGNDMYASELIDGFYDYVSDVKWFDFLRVRVLVSIDPEEGGNMLCRLIEYLQKSPDLDLLLEIACFLIHYGDINLFYQVVRQAKAQLVVEEEFQELLAIVADFYCFLDRSEPLQILDEILEKRSMIDFSAMITPQDPDLGLFDKLIESKDIK
jgi:hypothetical protein